MLLSMIGAKSEGQPGDALLDRYMPCASEKERNEARENLQWLAKVIARVEERLAREWHQGQIRESSDSAVESERVPPAPL